MGKNEKPAESAEKKPRKPRDPNAPKAQIAYAVTGEAGGKRFNIAFDKKSDARRKFDALVEGAATFGQSVTLTMERVSRKVVEQYPKV